MTMAKKKRKSGGRKSKGRRVGALAVEKGSGMKLLALAGGYLLGDAISAPLQTITEKVLPPKEGSNPAKTVVMAAELGIGGLLLLRSKGKIATLAGGVLAGAGIRRALSQMGVIKGYQNVPVIGRHRLAGYQSVPVIGATPPQLAGAPAQLQGFRVNGGLGTNGYGSQGSGVMGTVMNPNIAADRGSGLLASNASGYMG
jgi:hypothetical protein